MGIRQTPNAFQILMITKPNHVVTASTCQMRTYVPCIRCIELYYAGVSLKKTLKVDELWRLYKKYPDC